MFYKPILGASHKKVKMAVNANANIIIAPAADSVIRSPFLSLGFPS